MKKIILLTITILISACGQPAFAQTKQAKPVKKNLIGLQKDTNNSTGVDAPVGVITTGDKDTHQTLNDASKADQKEFEEWKKSKAKSDKTVLSEKELKELSDWENTIRQLEAELEKVKKELYETAIGQKFEAINAKLNLARSNYSVSFLLACSEHNIKATECKQTPDGKGIEKVVAPVPPNK